MSIFKRSFGDKQFKNDVTFALFGFFVLSPLSSIITVNFLHLPMSMPELLSIPFIYVLKEKVRSIKFDKNTFLILMLLLLLLVAWGFLWGEFSLFSIFSDARVWFLIFLMYCCFNRSNNINTDDFMYLSLGSLVGWALVSYTNFDKMVAGTLAGDETVCTYGAMLAIPVFLSNVIEKKKYLLLTVGLIVMAGIMLLAGIRRAIFIVAFSLVIVLIISSFRQPKLIFRYLIGGVLLFYVLSMTLPIAEEYIGGVSVNLRKRVFDRTESFLTTDISSSDDAVRLHNFQNLFNNFDEFLIPRGLIDTEAKNLKNVSFIDFPLSQLVWIFGFLGVLVILVYFARVAIINAKNYNRYKMPEYLMTTSSLIIMASLLFLEGTFLAFPYAAPYTGLLLGQSVLYSKRKRV